MGFFRTDTSIGRQGYMRTGIHELAGVSAGNRPIDTMFSAIPRVHTSKRHTTPPG